MWPYGGRVVVGGSEQGAEGDASGPRSGATPLRALPSNSANGASAEELALEAEVALQALNHADDGAGSGSQHRHVQQECRFLAGADQDGCDGDDCPRRTGGPAPPGHGSTPGLVQNQLSGHAGRGSAN